MRSFTSLWSALSVLTWVVSACPGDATPPLADPPCASESSAVAGVDPAAARSATVTPAAGGAQRVAPPDASEPPVAVAPNAEATRFTPGQLDAAALEALGIELAPTSKPDDVAALLAPFVARLGEVAGSRCRAGGIHGCGRLVALHATGALVPTNASAAAALRDEVVAGWTTACKGGDDAACISLLELPEAVAVSGRSALGRRACGRHLGRGCEVLAAAAERAPTRDALRVQAAGLYVDACDASDARACVRLAGMYRRDEVARAMRPRYRRVGLLEHARAIWRTSCDGGDLLACGDLGVSWLTGPKPDLYAARRAFARAGEGGGSHVTP